MEKQSLQNPKNAFEFQEPDAELSDNQYVKPENIGGTQKLHLKSNYFEAFSNMMKTSIGAGVLALPYTFMNTGIFLSIAMQIIVTIISIITTKYVFDVIDEVPVDDQGTHNSHSYLKSLGRNGVLVYRFFVSFGTISANISYIILFTNFFKIALHSLHLPYFVYAIIAFFVITPITFFKNMHFLAKYSFFGLLCAYITLAAIFEFSLEGIFTYDNSLPYWNFSNFGSSIGVVMFAYGSLPALILVRDSMEKPQESYQCAKNSIIYSMVIYIGFGLVCALGIPNVNGIVFIGLEKKRAYFYFFEALYALSLMFTYPVSIFQAFFYIEKLPILKKHENNNFIIIFYRFIVSVILFSISLTIPSIVAYLNLSGSIFHSSLQLIFPCYAYLKVFKNLSFSKKLVVYINLLLGIFFAIYGTYKSFSKMINQ